MCGICGVIDWSGSGDAAAIVRRMTPTMQHRGPDDEGIADFGAVSIGMRRLSIIDIEGGHQPMFNRDRSIGAVLNGEIYNFQELRAQLEDRGYMFSTRSDSEVAVYAYEEWGAQCVEHFEGMFAIAVFDQRTEVRSQKSEVRGQRSEVRGQRSDSEGQEARLSQHSALSTQHSGTLFLARDHLGVKPLYYTVQSPTSKVQGPDNEQNHRTSDLGPGTTFIFASEVRTLLASGLLPRRLSREGLESYLLFGSVGEPMTLIEGVFSLPPGHRMTINLNQPAARIEPESYWSIAARPSPIGRGGEGKPSRNGAPRSTNGSAANSVQQVRHLLEHSVRKHLIADVPVGVFLSSGIDSTALAALASKEAAGVHTFTVAFPEKEFSEADIARRTAARFGTTHQELMLNGGEMLARLHEAVNALDQPSMDGINTYFVSWGATQAGLKVALSGLGGDEIFGGYSNFRRTAHFQRFAAIGGAVPRSLRGAMASAVAGAGGHLVSRDAAEKLAAIWNGGDQSLPDAFFFGRNLFTPSQVTKLQREQRRNGAAAAWRSWLTDTASQARELDMFGAVTCMEARSYLVNTLLRDTDSMSMAHSLEVRVPFLDQPLVEFVTHLPQAEKSRKGIPKALLVDSLSDLLPAEVVDQTKRGFTFPWAEWLRGPLKAQVEQGLSDLSPALNEALDASETRRVWQDYLAGKTSWSRPWSLYVLNEWAKKHLDREAMSNEQ